MYDRPSRRRAARHGLIAVAVVAAWLLLAGAAQAQTLAPVNATYADPAAASGNASAADLLADAGELSPVAAGELTPGRYQADFHLRVSHIVDRFIARTEFKLTAKQGGQVLASRSFPLLAFDVPNRYQDMPLAFTVRETGPVTLHVSYAWQDLRGLTRPYPIESGNPEGANLDGGGGAEMQLVHALADIPWHVALDQVTLSPPRTVAVETFEVDKVRYTPGAAMTATATVTNHGRTARQVTAVLELVRDMDTVREAARQELTIAAGASEEVRIPATLLDAKWGREARLRILDGEAELDRAWEVFTIHDNPWAVAVGAFGVQLTYYRAGKNGEKADGLAAATKKGYGNIIEFVFWGEDDFGGLNPTETPFRSGQMHHESGAESTRQLIDAFHRVGIACTFYSLFTVADGKAGYELYRKNPDWFDPSFYDVSHLDRWDRSAELISWPRLLVRADTPEPYRHHAEEIIRSAKSFGWDGIRYDTDMSVSGMGGVDAHAAMYFPDTKKRVNEALPKFVWGYNDALHRRDLSAEPALQKLFKTLCEGGGMIMDEYNVHAFQDSWTYEKYAGRHRTIRDMVVKNGGHFNFCPFDVEWLNDQIYQGILPLVARAHHAWDPHRGDVPYANYHQFSTRYAGPLWDTKAVLLPEAAERLSWGDAGAALFHPHEYAYLRPREDGRHDLVLHLVNRPPERAVKYDDNRVSPPLFDVPGTIKLPAGQTVRAVYAATAEPVLSQTALAFQQTGDTVTFTVPRVKFWTMVVVELEKGEWP